MKILVTGGHGFVGSALTNALRERYPHARVLAPTSKELNLLDEAATCAWLKENRPDCVFHLAARLGGVGLVSGKPLAFLESNLRINLNLVSAANAAGGGYAVCRARFELLLCGGRAPAERGGLHLARAS